MSKTIDISAFSDELIDNSLKTDDLEPKQAKKTKKLKKSDKSSESERLESLGIDPYFFVQAFKGASITSFDTKIFLYKRLGFNFRRYFKCFSDGAEHLDAHTFNQTISKSGID